jgi:hypothetical protein
MTIRPNEPAHIAEHAAAKGVTRVPVGKKTADPRPRREVERLNRLAKANAKVAPAAKAAPKAKVAKQPKPAKVGGPHRFLRAFRVLVEQRDISAKDLAKKANMGAKMAGGCIMAWNAAATVSGSVSG